MSLKYAIIGSGAIGGYYGGKLARAGRDVHFLFYSDFEYIQEHGLSVDSVDGDFVVNPIKAYKATTEMPKCDVVLVCLKTTNNHLLKTLLPPIIHPNTLVVLIQNGLGLEADVAKDFPHLAIAGAMAFICSNKIGKGHINHLDQGSINIGSYSCKDTLLLEQVKDDFGNSGVNCNIVDLMSARWKKLIWNIPYNGMTVLLNTTTDQLMKDPNTRSLIRDMMIEVIQAANSILQDQFLIEETLADTMLKTTDRMAPYSPSMKLDFDHKRPLEIEYIYDRPISEARQHGYNMLRTSILAKQLAFIQGRY